MLNHFPSPALSLGRSSTRLLIAAFLITGTIGTTGCKQAVDPVSEQAKSDLLMSDAVTDGTMTIEEAIELVKQAGGESDSNDILIKAKIGSGKGDTFDAKSSAFLVSEIPTGEHAGDASHDAGNCPFCRAREAKAPTVMVRLLDKSGEPYAQSAETLLDLKNGQHVLVKGKGHFDNELNFFTVESQGIQLLK